LNNTFLGEVGLKLFVSKCSDVFGFVVNFERSIENKKPSSILKLDSAHFSKSPVSSAVKHPAAGTPTVEVARELQGYRVGLWGCNAYTTTRTTSQACTM